MGHLTLELILWLLLAFFIGCVLGCLFRKLFGDTSHDNSSSNTGTEPETKPEPVPVTAAKAAPQAATKAKDEGATGVAKRPKGLAGARDGKADALQRISGVGAKLEKNLQSLGYFHFDQIAGWSADEAQWVDEHLRFKGRIARDEWIAQAGLLAAGDEDRFAELFGPDGAKSKSASKSKKP